MRILICLLLGLWSVTFAAPPVISNIRAAQRPGTKLVDIYYDLSDADGDLQLVQVAASSDAGLTYGIPCVSLSGHAGANVSAGTNRKITWNAGADWSGNWVPQCRVRVTAHDGSTPPAPPGMAYIPGGPFQMGDNLDGSTNAMPVHNVQVEAFFMDKTEVTKELWQSVQTWGTNNGYSIEAGSSYGNGHPAHSMSWRAAVVWCNARSAKEGLNPCYYADSSKVTILKSAVNIDSNMVKWEANGYRLPTEAEWEKAARGGATGLRFPWGNTITHNDANYRSFTDIPYDVSQTRGRHPSYAATAPVGSFAPNSYGLYDMMGNVWEWCWDWHSISYYGTPESLVNPTGSSVGSAKINRGSSFQSDGAAAGRNSHRGGWSASGSRDDFGFRTVRR